MAVTQLHFSESVRWSEYGMLCFIVSPFLVRPVYSSNIINFDFYFWNIVLSALFFWTPLLLALLTYEKLVKPLNKGEIPKNIRKWSIFLTVMGFLGLGIGVYILAHADEKIKNLMIYKN